MPLIEIARFPERILGELARGRPAVEGIAAELDTRLFNGGLGGPGIGVMGGVRVMIEDSDVPMAAWTLDIVPG